MKSRALWWTLVAALTAVLAGTSLLAGAQWNDATEPRPIDSQQTREMLADIAKQSVVAILSYMPQNAETQLTAAAKLTTGEFHAQYTELIHETVIPAARVNRASPPKPRSLQSVSLR